MVAALARFERVRIDIGEDAAAAERFGVQHAIPVVMVLGPDGKEIARRVGFCPPGEMVAWLGALPAPSAAPSAGAAAPPAR